MNVLYLSYFSPPHYYNHVAANRSRRFAQYLTQAGCGVRLVSEQFSEPIIRQSHAPEEQAEKGIINQSVASWSIVRHYGVVDVYWGWVAPTLWLCCKQILVKRPDVILVSCPPFSSSLVGYYLSRWFNLPLVLDFRDGWSRASYFSEGKISPWEKRVLKQASKLIVTSQSDWIAYQQLVGEKKVAWIPDSYDSILDHVSGKEDLFTIGYNGSWGDFRCSAKGILSQLASVDFPFRFISIGKYQPDFCSWVEQYGLAGSVFMFEPVDNTQAQELLRQCDALFIHKGPPDRGKSDTHLATQAIDYVASGRLILAELPEGETLSFLRRFAGQLYEVDAKYTGEYQQQLSALYHRWQQQPEQRYFPSSEFYQAFDPQTLASRLYQLLNEVRFHALAS